MMNNLLIDDYGERNASIREEYKEIVHEWMGVNIHHLHEMSLPI